MQLSGRSSTIAAQFFSGALFNYWTALANIATRSIRAARETFTNPITAAWKFKNQSLLPIHHAFEGFLDNTVNRKQRKKLSRSPKCLPWTTGFPWRLIIDPSSINFVWFLSCKFKSVYISTWMVLIPLALLLWGDGINIFDLPFNRREPPKTIIIVVHSYGKNSQNRLYKHRLFSAWFLAFVHAWVFIAIAESFLCANHKVNWANRLLHL